MKIKLKALRVNAEMTQEEAARKMNVTRETIQNWEAHRTFPNMNAMGRLCDLYGCTLDDIFIPSSLANNESKGKN